MRIFLKVVGYVFLILFGIDIVYIISGLAAARHSLDEILWHFFWAVGIVALGIYLVTRKMKYRIRHLSSEELQWTKEKYPQVGAQAYAIFDSDVLTLDGDRIIIAYHATREEAEDARRRYYRIFRLFKQWLKDTTPELNIFIKEENVASLVRHVISCQTEEGEEINLDYWFKRHEFLSMEPQEAQERRMTMVGGKHSIIKQFSLKELRGPSGSYYGIISGGGAKVMSWLTEEQAQYFLRLLERISCLFEQWAKDTAIALDSSIDEVAKVVRGLKV